MDKLKIRLLAVASLVACGATADVPYVTGVSLDPGSGSREATVTYTLHNAPAVITFDIQTNVTVGGVTTWASIGANHLAYVSPDSATFRKVDADGTYTIRWSANDDTCNFSIGGNGTRAVVTAWAIDDTPDYMVVNLASNTTTHASVRYYPSVDHLPGGILSNLGYRTSLLVMRRIHARGVPWTMGSVAEAGREATRETTHPVMLTNDYYMAVFPFTQSQYYLVSKATPSYFTQVRFRTLRPVEKVNWNTAITFLTNTLSAKTGLDFTLPGEAQWEFAARAGNGERRWGDGSRQSSTNIPGRCQSTGGYPSVGDENYGNTSTNAWTAVNGTAECGSYAPNAWGLYDMCGNVAEWCLDWYIADISGLGGAVITDGFPGASDSSKVCRGGTFEMHWTLLRPARRDMSAWTSDWRTRGFRPICRAGLK